MTKSPTKNFAINIKSPVNKLRSNDTYVRVPPHKNIMENQKDVNMLLIPIFI